MSTISIKELRATLANIADQVTNNGESFEVFRRSQPVFKIVPIDAATDEKWETVVDFTGGGQTDGLDINAALNLLA